MDRHSEQSTRWLIDEVLPHEGDLRCWLQGRFPVIRDVDDLVQEAFTRILKAYESGPIVNPRAFLFVVARNIALNHIRHLQYERPDGAREVDALSIIDQVNTPPEDLVQNEEIQCLVRAIQSLPKKCRQVMTLRKIYGLSQKEVARRLGISVNTVENQSAIGLHKCRLYFKEAGYIPRHPS
jgi:RNA polymerase sigma-70 factor (ECF subfamily)